MSDEAVDGQFRGSFREFWTTNSSSALALVVWDAFKAYTSGQYQFIIANVHRERRAELNSAEREAGLQEAIFVRYKDP